MSESKRNVNFEFVFVLNGIVPESEKRFTLILYIFLKKIGQPLKKSQRSEKDARLEAYLSGGQWKTSK